MKLLFRLWYWQLLGNLLARVERWYDKHSPVMRVVLLDEDADPAVHTCGECGRLLEHVRPGKWQCNNCEREDDNERQ